MIKTRIKKVETENDVKYYVQTRGLPADFFYGGAWWWLLVPIINIFLIIILLVIIAELIIWKDECKRHGDVPGADIGIYNNIYDAQEHCDIILKEDVKPTKLKKAKKKITYIKYP